MFANSRTDSEMIRTRCEITSITNSGTAATPVMPPGHEGLQVADEAVLADALDVVGEPHDEREHERDRDVRRGGVDRERRDLEPEDVDLLVRVRRQRDVAEHVREPDEEEERRDEREPAGGELRVVQVPARDVVLRQVVGDLDRHLRLVRLVDHPLGDPDHREAGERRREEEVEDRAVDRHVDAGDVDLDPRLEPELLLGLERVVLAVGAEDREQQRRRARRTRRRPMRTLVRVFIARASSSGLTMKSVAK